MDHRHHRAGRDRHRRVVVGRLGRRQQQRCAGADDSARNDRCGDFAHDRNSRRRAHDRLRHNNSGAHEPDALDGSGALRQYGLAAAR
jgi:hypothetical protein